MRRSVEDGGVFISSLISLLLIPAAGWSNPISVGGTIIEISPPPGFVVVTPEMTILSEYQKNFVPATNERFASYIAEADVPQALKGGLPASGRRFSVQTVKSLINVSVSTSDFSHFKQSIKTQNAELFNKLQEALPGLLENANKGVSKQSDADLTMSIGQIVPLPPHEETDRTLAFSMFARAGAHDEVGNEASTVVVTTTTVVYVKAKVLFLYSYAEESGLEWSREISKQWADSIVSANPPDVVSSIRESTPSVVRRMDWEKIAGKAIAGGAVGSICVLIGWMRHRSKKGAAKT